MSDFLSQDQIDSLLSENNAGSFDVGDVDDGASSESGGPDYEALKEAFNLFNENASTVITTVLNREIQFSVTQCEVADKDAVKGAVSEPVLSITIPVEGAVNGVMTVIMGTKEVALLSDLMMMGDGTAEYSEDHKDAIGELFNQIMGSFTTALGDHCGDSVSTGTIEVNEYTYENTEISFDSADMIIDNLNITDIGDSSFAIILQQEFSTQLMDKFKTRGGDSALDESQGFSASDVDELSQMSTGFDGDGSGGGGDAFQDMGGMQTPAVNAPKENIAMLLDIEMDVCIELGKTELSIKRILELSPGSIVELDRMAGEPVDLMVNKKVVAKGEVVVVDENFGIRIVSLVSPEERIKSLR